MKKVKKSTIHAVEYAIQNPQISISKIGDMFGENRKTIAKYKTNNLYLNYRFENQTNLDDEYLYYFTDEELDIIKFYLEHPNSPYKDVQEKYPNAPERRALYRWLEILGKEKTIGGAQKYNYDRSKFKTIDTEEDAYWLGFITADGCIIENKWLSIRLAEKDKHHLEKFCQYLQLSENETKEILKFQTGGAYSGNNPCTDLKVCSLEILQNLKEKGIKPRKSGQEQPYKCASIDLEKAYIRGLIDGDGYIRSTQYGMGIVGSKEICQYVQDFICNNIIDISTNHIREHGIIYKLELSGKLQVTKILDYLYENSNIYLDRKYQLYKNNYSKHHCRE